MSTNRQRLRAIAKYLKTDIKKNFKKLLITAVLLFGASWAVIAPVKGIEQFFYHFAESNDSFVIEDSIYPEVYLEEITASKTYLSANSLAALTGQPAPADIENYYYDEETGLITVQNQALVSQDSPLTTISQNMRDGIIGYTVQEGDTPSSIAAAFGISVNTLCWANNLKTNSIIRPGDELKILPISGIILQIKSGQTIDSIAKTYQAKSNEIITFNSLPADGAIQIGQKIIIPDGVMPAPAPVPTKKIDIASISGAGTGKSRVFPIGQCTWYVAQKRYVPWSGHAKSWLDNAKAYGFTTGNSPQAGAIMVLSEGGWTGRLYGHVAYVEAVNGEWVTISEMNYTGLGIKSVRTLHINDKRIRGYIY